MVNLALYGQGMSVSAALDVFKGLSSCVFRGRNRFGFGPINSFYAFLMAYRSGRYPSVDIDGSLHNIFGTTTMLEHPYMTSIGARTGFPVVDLDTLNTCIVTSYNGAGAVPQGPATYKLLQSTGPRDEILVKHA
jgi:hypothetical protein